MRNYLLILNGTAIADFMTYGRALSAFRRKMCHIDSDSELELYRLSDGHRIASSI